MCQQHTCPGDIILVQNMQSSFVTSNNDALNTATIKTLSTELQQQA